MSDNIGDLFSDFEAQEPSAKQDYPILHDARMRRWQEILDKREKESKRDLCVEHLGTGIEYCSLYETNRCPMRCKYAQDRKKWDNKPIERSEEE